MRPELARRKLAAFLRDPPQKPFVLGRGHERYAAALIEQLADLAGIPATARAADHLASAADRPNFPSDLHAIDFSQRPVLTHPLARVEPLTLAPLATAVEPEAVSEVVARAAAAIAAACGPDLERRYLATWRWLPAFVRAAESADQRLGALWEWLPADTRVPDHSIWDHMGITAALAGAGDHPALLVFALGPVQGFIAQARTTRDLWAGSYLLAWLSWHAVRAVADELGPDAVLYPALREQPLVDAWLRDKGVPVPGAAPMAPVATRRVAGLPNKLLAILPHADVAQLAAQAAHATRQAWQELASQVAARLAAQAPEQWRPEHWLEQIDGQLETSWAALAWPEAGKEAGWLEQMRGLIGADGLAGFESALATYALHGRFTVNPGSYYAPLHSLLQRAFDSRKLTRPFVPTGEPGYKCTLCGERAPALAAEAAYAEQVATWQRLGAALARPGLVPPDGRERLCAVCLTKRLAPEAPLIHSALDDELMEFPSTSSLATLPFRRRLVEQLATQPQLARTTEAFVQALGTLAGPIRAYGATIYPSGRRFPTLSERLRALSRPLRRLGELDGEWLLEETYERWRAELVRARADTDLLHALAAAQQALDRLLRTAREAGLGRPSVYYALLLLDGDRMGRWVSGEQHQTTLGNVLHPAIDHELRWRGDWADLLASRRLFAPSTHAALGTILRDFALWVVPHEVEQRADVPVVYAGGDDVLALLPTDQALVALDGLRQRYQAGFLLRDPRGRIYDALPTQPTPDLVVFRGMGRDATLSAGVLFAHHLYPLGLALEEARRLEACAKEAGGRDAVALGVAHRSGPDAELELVSHHVRGGRPLVDLLVAARALLAVPGDAEQNEEPVSAAGRLPYRLRELAPTLDGLADPEARRATVLAVATRQITSTASRAELAALYDALAAPRPGDQSTAPHPVADLAVLLRLARFLESEA